MIYYISGGERSGKSRYAMELALGLSENPVYLATSRKWDADFEKRVERHKNERDERWETWEVEKLIGKLDISGRVVVLDCITLWLTNWFMDLEQDIDACMKQGKQELKQLFGQEGTLIIISNEIGMGGHAESHIGRKFTELQGWMNQFVAKSADKAVFMVSGLPLQLK
ncbi:bifunctional adenosylcobinamide kinase/adenosylcobinamide-phosphate guanylyltransferase [Ulvibacterium sp.]|uniref:bifunctional adenosylcobinamide kinase/adenosylcobinamide-phosphate guanylyltransferase n=1 Tax=Ulvibacterium sp. TaxID=2665914 RepID=UPI0026227FAA|nr:bifunctional adenosylcobinamide kinase/adenosylcobinamide-phosphate guanylyltransferase [Ulvibacterium sp.]